MMLYRFEVSRVLYSSYTVYSTCREVSNRIGNRSIVLDLVVNVRLGLID